MDVATHVSLLIRSRKAEDRSFYCGVLRLDHILFCFQVIVNNLTFSLSIPLKVSNLMIGWIFLSMAIFEAAPCSWTLAKASQVQQKCFPLRKESSLSPVLKKQLLLQHLKQQPGSSCCLLSRSPGLFSEVYNTTSGFVPTFEFLLKPYIVHRPIDAQSCQTFWTWNFQTNFLLWVLVNDTVA